MTESQVLNKADLRAKGEVEHTKVRAVVIRQSSLPRSYPCRLAVQHAAREGCSATIDLPVRSSVTCTVRYAHVGHRTRAAAPWSEHTLACVLSEHQAERNILASMTGIPFMVDLYYAFQSSQSLYLVLDFMQGGELFFHLRRQKRFPEAIVRFYAAQVRPRPAIRPRPAGSRAPLPAARRPQL